MDRAIIETILFYAMITCFSIGGFALLMLLLGELIDTSTFTLNPRYSKIQICRKAIEWCMHELGLPKGKARPHIKLTYKKATKEMGIYHYNQNLIIVHLNHKHHKSVREFCNTIIHEYVHHIQFTSSQICYEYEKETSESGCWYNRFEVEARKISSALENKLFEYLLQQQYIIKQDPKD